MLATRIRKALGNLKTFPLEVWGWRIGEAVELGTMAEASSCIQQNVRACGSTWSTARSATCPPEPLYNVENYQVFTYLVTGTSSVLDVLHGEAFAE